ncbi:MAG: 30S ribosome-binding factor RbfA [Thermoanaerobacterales bacterium]|nr:30S ribosome-binding factor RbfA [Bacillota bacterium]MDI6906248.1 30S ribosome-binding factor RbfA [Thermoanaerobacterales bacterium]
MAYRPERLAEVIKAETAEILRQLKDPRIGFATVTAVDVSSDLRYAKIRVSVLGNPDEQEQTLRTLQRAQGFVRTELGRRIRLRYAPEVTFTLDDSIREGIRLTTLIDEISKREEGGPRER